jgi:putative addiction module component (TIGR02574 family)
MSTTDLPSEILGLPVEDRIQLAMSIWDSVAEDVVHLSDEEKQLLDKRLREHHENPSAGDSWEAVRDRLWKGK